MPEYRGPPLENCPYCLSVGRGMVTFLPVFIGYGEVMWLCKNWSICLFPHIYGREFVRSQTVPQSSVDPKLMGYIPMFEGDKGPQRRSPDVIVEERGSAVVECQEAVSSAPSPSTISHSTTTSEGSEHDITQLQSAAAMAPLRTAAPLMVDFSPPPAAKRVIRPTVRPTIRPQEYRLSRFPTPASLPASSTPVAPMPPAAPIVRARKRPLIDTPGSEKITFPGYGERSNTAAAAPASTSSSSTATVFAMVAKQLKKIKRSNM